MISNQAPQGQAPAAVRPDGPAAAPLAGGSVGARIRGMNVIAPVSQAVPLEVLPPLTEPGRITAVHTGQYDAQGTLDAEVQANALGGG